MNLPSDIETYIHRIGRAGRLKMGRLVRADCGALVIRVHRFFFSSTSLFDPNDPQDRDLAPHLIKVGDDSNANERACLLLGARKLGPRSAGLYARGLGAAARRKSCDGRCKAAGGARRARFWLARLVDNHRFIYCSFSVLIIFTTWYQFVHKPRATLQGIGAHESNVERRRRPAARLSESNSPDVSADGSVRSSKVRLEFVINGAPTVIPRARARSTIRLIGGGERRVSRMPPVHTRRERRPTVVVVDERAGGRRKNTQKTRANDGRTRASRRDTLMRCAASESQTVFAKARAPIFLRHGDSRRAQLIDERRVD